MFDEVLPVGSERGNSRHQASAPYRSASCARVMVLMALDHARLLCPGSFNPRDIAEPALFLTRWITHFCAPTFIFLAGISAFLYGAQGRSPGAVSRFLLTRGLWLVLIEFTVVRLGWTFSFHFDRLVMQVIFAIGVSMMALALLVYLRPWAIAAVAIAMIAGHNMLDGIKPEQFGAAAPIWNVLHQPGPVALATRCAVPPRNHGSVDGGLCARQFSIRPRRPHALAAGPGRRHGRLYFARE